MREGRRTEEVVLDQAGIAEKKTCHKSPCFGYPTVPTGRTHVPGWIRKLTKKETNIEKGIDR